VDKERVGCLITEVVVPGFDWRDHRWMTAADLNELFGEDEEKYGEIRKELEACIHPN
jgi:predicted cupin superfamily sugar epimerase